MGKYEVTVERTAMDVYYVEAANEDQAIDLVLDKDDSVEYFGEAVGIEDDSLVVGVVEVE